jgi:hypothetical protein
MYTPPVLNDVINFKFAFNWTLKYWTF